eukprot:1182702-Prorocentrum_minimum.AAC.2
MRNHDDRHRNQHHSRGRVHHKGRHSRCSRARGAGGQTGDVNSSYLKAVSVYTRGPGTSPGFGAHPRAEA